MAAIAFWPSLALITLRDLLTAALIDDIDGEDPARAGVVKIGSLQADPLRAVVSVEIHENDPEGENNWHHAVVNRLGNDENPGGLSHYVGSTRHRWLRRFTVRVLVFLRDSDREAAAAIKGTVIARIEQVLLRYPTLDGLIDDAGEYALSSVLRDMNTTLGGDNKTPIWRSKLWIQFLTTRPGKIL